MENLKLVLRNNITDIDVLDTISTNCIAILQISKDYSNYWIEILTPNDLGIFKVENRYTNDIQYAYILFLEFYFDNN
jgi:hypothetical protein